LVIDLNREREIVRVVGGQGAESRTYRYVFEKRQALAPLDNLVQSVISNGTKILDEVSAAIGGSSLQAKKNK